MTEYVQVVLIANVFRVLCLLLGFGFAYLGYRLYVIGVFDKAQELKAAFGNANLTIKQVAPGIVFGIAGIVIAALGVVRPIAIERSQTASDKGLLSLSPSVTDVRTANSLQTVQSCGACTNEEKASRINVYEEKENANEEKANRIKERDKLVENKP